VRCNTCVSRSTRGAPGSDGRGEPVALVIDHPNYRHRTIMSRACGRRVAQDLRAA